MDATGWATNQGVRLEYLERRLEPNGALVPVLFIPGSLGAADAYRTELAALAPRHALAVSLRGRGRSDAPERGYTFADHVGDITAVVEQTGLDGFCLVAYSQSVPYAIAYAAQHPHWLAGLVLGDYPARAPALPAVWRDHALAAGRVPAHVAHSLQRESAEVSLWDRLPLIPCPVLVLRGGQPGALLSAENAARYARELPNAEVVTFEDAGHELWQPDAGRYLGTLQAFFTKLDAARGLQQT